MRLVSLFDFTFAILYITFKLLTSYQHKFIRLGLFIYNVFLFLYKAGIRITALFSVKAKKWLSGRKGLLEQLQHELRQLQLVGSSNQHIENYNMKEASFVWMHCASLGEFEQGRPLLEKLKVQYPNYKFLLTFFSPSGYEIRKDYKGADYVCYLPLDSPRNAQRFLEIVNPSLVIFVKYEYWYYYLREIKQRNIPLLMVSAFFRKDAPFFKWYGGLQRKMLTFFTHLFVQNQSSLELLETINQSGKTSVAGDTRFDRVIEIAESASTIEGIEEFLRNSKNIIAGSTWPKDEDVLRGSLQAINDPSLKLVIAPHEISKHRISGLKDQFPGSLLYSQYKATGLLPTPNSNVLIIDSIGMLSRLYKYAYVTYVGGGFGKGIHNTLEAAVFGKPVLFGPAYGKFNEAIDLVAIGGAVSIRNVHECTMALQKLLQDQNEYLNSCSKSKEYVYANKGATQKITQFIQEKRLLTS